MKHIITFGLLLCATLAGFSQGANKAAGIRGGLSSGFEYRVFAEELSSYKVLLSTRKDGIQLTGMKEFHRPDVFNVGQELSFVYGAGIHAGIESWRHYHYDPFIPSGYYIKKHTGPIAGLDALAALEYTIPTLPLIAGIEAKPYFNLFGEHFFDLQIWDFAFTLKYTF